MVILNIYGKISSICISEKLKVFISNLPNQLDNDWREELVKDMLQEINEQAFSIKRYGNSIATYDLRKICMETLGFDKLSEDMTEKEYLQIIADNLICIYFDYEYEDMPFFDWTSNCFDGRFCEEDYGEKLVKFLHFFVYKVEQLNSGGYSSFASIIYTSNHDREYSHLLACLNVKWQSSETYINSLKNWGKLIDNFLVTKNDYLQLDYLINSVYKDNEYNAYHLFKVFSLCEMLLEKNIHNGGPILIDNKLPIFLSKKYSKEDRLDFSKMIRQIRNKIGHGDFLQLNYILEKYAQKFMDGQYNYDYTEYSRLNWIYLHLCCELDDALARILFLLFTDRKEFEKIKQE